jgi:serine-type D-Ala-D-Ala carboxypeptidase (penicillin-binding protein 5/6)
MMKFFLKIIFLVAVVSSFTLLNAAAAPAPAAAPAFQVNARSALLINALTGKVVFEQNADDKIPPASLIKIMTLFLVYDALDSGNLKLTDMVSISQRAWKFGGSQMYLEVGMQVPVSDIIKGIAVVSGNDACVAAAEHLSGTEEVFVALMNKKAAEIGMTSSLFKNCHGLPVDGQYTTARDMATLTYNYLKTHPHALEIHSLKEFTFNNITQQNRNKLLWRDPSVDGLKTGWIRESGYHLVATAHKDTDRYIAVVMGAKNHTIREEEAMKLLNYGFRNFKTSELVQKGTPVATVLVRNGIEGEVSLAAVESSFVTVPRDQAGSIKVQQDVPAEVFAPVAKDQKIGFLKITIEGKPFAEIPLAALAAVDKTGFVKQAAQTIGRSFVTAPYWGIMVIVLIIIAIFVGISRTKVIGGKKKKDNSLVP